MTNDSSKHNDSSQAERFKEGARALGADEGEAAFKEKLGVIARQKLKSEAKMPKEVTDE